VHPQGRHTPYHKPHSTEIAGLTNISGGDNRFYNNIFVGGTGTKIYDDAKLLPMQAEGNIYLNGSAPYLGEKNSREPLKIAFVTRTSEIFVSEAEVKNRRRHS